MNKLLIVDDEENIVEVLKEYSLFNGFDVDIAYDGKQAVELALKNNYDCMLIDIMMPNLNGFDAVKEIKQHKNIPTIMISARSEEYDKLLGFELGVDDYVVKPFSPREVMARVKAVLKRYSTSNSDMIKTNGITIDKNGRDVFVDGEKIQLTNKEFDLLLYFIENKNIALSREKLLSDIWGFDYFGDGRTVDTHIKMLRSHLNNKADVIKTVHGVGYKFEEI